MTDKKLAKIQKKLEACIDELDAMSEQELQKTVCQASEAIAKAAQELDENEAYQTAKQDVKDLSGGFRDVKSYQGAKIAYSLHRLKGL